MEFCQSSKIRYACKSLILNVIKICSQSGIIKIIKFVMSKIPPRRIREGPEGERPDGRRLEPGRTLPGAWAGAAWSLGGAGMGLGRMKMTARESFFPLSARENSEFMLAPPPEAGRASSRGEERGGMP